MAAAAACAAAASAAAASAGSTRELPLICTPSDASSVIAARRSDGVPFREEPSSPTVSDGDATACATGVGRRRLAVADVGGGGVNGGAGPAADTASSAASVRACAAAVAAALVARAALISSSLALAAASDARAASSAAASATRASILALAAARVDAIAWWWPDGRGKWPNHLTWLSGRRPYSPLSSTTAAHPPPPPPPPPPPRPSSPSPVPPPISSWYAAERRQTRCPALQPTSRGSLRGVKDARATPCDVRIDR